MLTSSPTDAVLAARQLLQVATTARDAGVDVPELAWIGGVLVVTVTDSAGVDRLGDALGLPSYPSPPAAPRMRIGDLDPQGHPVLVKTQALRPVPFGAAS